MARSSGSRTRSSFSVPRPDKLVTYPRTFQPIDKVSQCEKSLEDWNTDENEATTAMLCHNTMLTMFTSFPVKPYQTKK